MTRAFRSRLRAGAIIAALKNRKTVDLQLDPSSPCASVPYGCDRLRLALRMQPRPDIRVSGLGLHADIRRNGVNHRICVPWHAITSWSAKAC